MARSIPEKTLPAPLQRLERGALAEQESNRVVELRQELRRRVTTPERLEAIIQRLDRELAGDEDVKITPKILEIVFNSGLKPSSGDGERRLPHIHIHGLPEEELNRFVATGIRSIQASTTPAPPVIDVKAEPEAPKKRLHPSKDPDLVY